MKTVTIPLSEYEEMQEEIKTLRKSNAQKTIEVYALSRYQDKILAIMIILVFVFTLFKS